MVNQKLKESVVESRYFYDGPLTIQRSDVSLTVIRIFK